MAYSSFIRPVGEISSKLSNYDSLAVHLYASRNHENIYVLVTQQGDGKPEVNSAIKAIIDMGEDCAYIVIGNQQTAQNIAKQIWESNSEVVGIAAKVENHNALKVYQHARNARFIAKENEEPFHIYNSKKDSVQARLESLINS